MEADGEQQSAAGVSCSVATADTVTPLVAKLENVTRWELVRESASSEAQPRHPSPGRAPAPERSVVLLPFIGSPTPTVVESPSAT